MAGDDVHIRVADGDERLVEVAFAANLAGGAQQAAMGRALEPPLDGVGTHTDPFLSRPGVWQGQAAADRTVCDLASRRTPVFSSDVPTVGLSDQAQGPIGGRAPPAAAAREDIGSLANAPRNGYRQRRRFPRGQQS